MKNKKICLGIILIILILLFLPKLVLPSLINNRVTQSIQQEYNPKHVEVNLQTKYGWNLLVGKIDEFALNMQDFHIGELPVESFIIDIVDGRIDIWSLFTRNEFIYRDARSLQASISLLEEGLNKYFWEKVDPSQSFAIKLQDEHALLSGEVDLFNDNWDISLLGSFDIRNYNKIVFIPQELVLDKTMVPRALLEILSERYELLLDFSVLPVPVQIDKIDVSNERIVIHGSDIK